MNKEHDLKPKMVFYQNIQRIVESLKMISAAKSKQLVLKYKKAKNFSHHYNNNLKNYHLINENRSQGKNLLVLIGANRGLCGNYVSSLNGLLKNVELNSYRWILIGNKLPTLCKNIAKENIVFESAFDYSQENLDLLSEKIMQVQAQQIEVISWTPGFDQSLRQELIEQPDTSDDISLAHSPKMSKHWLDITNRQIITSRLYQFIVGASCMEETRRLFAMDQAVRNGDKIISSLKNQINQVRQQSITTELNEIISGSEYGG